LVSLAIATLADSGDMEFSFSTIYFRALKSLTGMLELIVKGESDRI